MVKCKDCDSHIEEGNKCVILAAPLAFPPDQEVICKDFEPKKVVETKPETPVETEAEARGAT